MKLLLDENRSVRLVSPLVDLYTDMTHMCEVGLSGASDEAVWPYAKAQRVYHRLKDSDFAERSAFDQHAGKVVWIRLGNCSTNELEQLLRSAFEVIRAFLEEDPETCLLLRRT